MKFNEIAAELVAGCREGREAENLTKLYSENAVSVEAQDMGGGRETLGIDGIRGKHAWWESAYQLVSADISDPFPHGEDRFAVIFEIKAKNNDTNEIEDMKEVAIYTVSNGKIVKEEFFYE